jgi:hypothetical protein
MVEGSAATRSSYAPVSQATTHAPGYTGSRSDTTPQAPVVQPIQPTPQDFSKQGGGVYSNLPPGAGQPGVNVKAIERTVQPGVQATDKPGESQAKFQAIGGGASTTVIEQRLAKEDVAKYIPAAPISTQPTALEQIRAQPGYAVTIDRSQEINTMLGLRDYRRELFPMLYQPPTPKPPEVDITKFYTYPIYSRLYAASQIAQSGFESVIGYSSETSIPQKLVSGAGSTITGFPQYVGTGLIGTELSIRKPSEALKSFVPGAGLFIEPTKPSYIVRGAMQMGSDIFAQAQEKPIETSGMVVGLLALSKAGRVAKTFKTSNIKEFFGSEAASSYRKGEIDPWKNVPTMRQTAEETGIEFRGGDKPPTPLQETPLLPSESETRTITGQYLVLKTELKPPEQITEAAQIQRQLQIYELPQISRQITKQAEIQKPTTKESVVYTQLIPAQRQAVMQELQSMSARQLQIQTRIQRTSQIQELQQLQTPIQIFGQVQVPIQAPVQIQRQVQISELQQIQQQVQVQQLQSLQIAIQQQLQIPKIELPKYDMLKPIKRKKVSKEKYIFGERTTPLIEPLAGIKNLNIFGTKKRAK